jgi:heterokaryon incompatibility protein (HET)
VEITNSRTSLNTGSLDRAMELPSISQVYAFTTSPKSQNSQDSDRRSSRSFASVHSILNPPASDDVEPRGRRRSAAQMEVECEPVTLPASRPPMPRRILTPISPTLHRTTSISRITGTIDGHSTPFLTNLVEPKGDGLPPRQYYHPPSPIRNSRQQSEDAIPSARASPSRSYTSCSRSGQASPALPSPFSRRGSSPSSFSLSSNPTAGQVVSPAPTVQTTWESFTIHSSNGPVSIPVEVSVASRQADEKRRRNLGASARFRQRRKEKEREANNMIEKLRDELRESKAERDRLSELVQRFTGSAPHVPRSPSTNVSRGASASPVSVLSTSQTFPNSSPHTYWSVPDKDTIAHGQASPTMSDISIQHSRPQSSWTSSWHMVVDASNVMPPVIPFREDSPPIHHSNPGIASNSCPLTGIDPKTVEDEYTYTSIGTDEVRMVQLYKGNFNDPLRCGLRSMHATALEGIPYYALSYAWGDDKAMCEIFLHDDVFYADSFDNSAISGTTNIQAFPRRFLLRSNLYLALKQLRSTDEPIYLWADAICINQKDGLEKSHQLPRMLDIYSNARSVCIWLGEFEPVKYLDGAGADPLDFIHSIVNLNSFDRIIATGVPSKEVVASLISFANLLKKSWFGRRWVIQEVSASRNASVHYGDKKVNWIDFADALQLFLARIDRIRAIYNGSELFKRNPDALGHIESVGAGAIVRACSDLLQKMENGKVVSRLWDIESLVMTFQHFETSDPRDTIYALLSLASDGHMAPRELDSSNAASLVPDYTKSTLQVYAEFVRHCVQSNGSLDIICRHWALPVEDFDCLGEAPRSAFSLTPPPNSGIPTWIGLVTDSPFGPPSGFTGRLNGDSLVGEPRRRIYNASRNRLASVRFSSLDSLSTPKLPAAQPGWLLPISSGDQGDITFDRPYAGSRLRPTLSAKGISLGRVNKTSGRVVDGTIPVECLRMAGWKRVMGVDNIPDRLWKTLVADRDSQGDKPPLWWRRACMQCLLKANQNGDLNTSKLMTNWSLPTFTIEFLKRVQAIVWNRKFFVFRSYRDGPDSLFGLGPSDVREDDVVCILFGCSVPVILRPNHDGTAHEFVGECYVHGKMDGEALAAMDENSISDATLEFNIQ